jgi:phenylacetate-CoA ligase
VSLLARLDGTLRVLARARRERRVPYLPADEQRRTRDRRVRAIVAHAYRTVPYYRETMGRLGLTPADFRSADDLARLPLLSKEEIAADPERFRSTAVDPVRCLPLATTGTSGPRLTVLHDPEAMRLNLACAGRETVAITRAIGRPLFGLRLATFRVPWGVPETTQRFYRAQAFLPTRRLALSPYDPLEQSLARLDRFRPHIIAGVGSHTGMLFRLYLEGRIRFRLPRAVVFGGDAFPERVRARLEQEYGIPVFSCYGATEAPRIGFSCEERRGLHLHTDLCHVRIVDEADAAGKGPGDGPGELVISNLTNRVTVLLNYRLGDRGAFGERGCPCGRTLPLLDGLIGRIDEAIPLPNGRFLTRFDLYPVLRSRPDLLEYQLVQTAQDALTVRVVPDPGADFARIEREVRQGFQAMVGHQVRVDVERVAVIPRLPGGKVAVISALPRS